VRRNLRFYSASAEPLFFWPKTLASIRVKKVNNGSKTLPWVLEYFYLIVGYVACYSAFLMEYDSHSGLQLFIQHRPILSFAGHRSWCPVPCQDIQI
jgi:hypothetical protein